MEAPTPARHCRQRSGRGSPRHSRRRSTIDSRAGGNRMSRAATLLEKFPSLHVAVVGDAMLDVYLRGHASRLCQEAAVPVIEFDASDDAPGGAANTAGSV